MSNNQSKSLTCERVGCKPYSWNLEEPFSKFGFEDTDRDEGLWATVKFIKEQGYNVRTEQWGIHGSPITYIGIGTTRVYPADGYEIGGYDKRSPLAVLPPDLVHALNVWQLTPEFAELVGVPMDMPENLFHTLTFDEPIDDEGESEGD